jgi:hypothetical protein
MATVVVCIGAGVFYHGMEGFVMSATAGSTGGVASSGSGAPGGSAGQLQYNLTGVFAGSMLWWSNNVLEQYNGATAQKSLLYNSRTDGANYERAVIDWATLPNVLSLGTEALGSGAVRNIALVGGNVGIGATIWPGALTIQKDIATVNTGALYLLGAGMAAVTSAGGAYIGVNAPAAFVGNLFEFRQSGTARAMLSASGTFNVNLLGNTSSSSNAQLALATTGMTLSRNIADASPAVVVQQTHASSTGDILQVKNSAATVVTVTQAGQLQCTGSIKSQSTTVAALVAAATAGSGARSFVTDATATTFLSIAAGGGANKVPVVSDGTNWLIG